MKKGAAAGKRRRRGAGGGDSAGMRKRRKKDEGPGNGFAEGASDEGTSGMAGGEDERDSEVRPGCMRGTPLCDSLNPTLHSLR